MIRAGFRSVHLGVFLDDGVRAGAAFFAGARNCPVRASRTIRTSFPGCFTMTFGCFLTSGISCSFSGVVEAREVDLARPFPVEERKALTVAEREPVPAAPEYLL